MRIRVIKVLDDPASVFKEVEGDFVGRFERAVEGPKERRPQGIESVLIEPEEFFGIALDLEDLDARRMDGQVAFQTRRQPIGQEDRFSVGDEILQFCFEPGIF